MMSKPLSPKDALAPSEVATAPSLKLMTYNVNFGCCINTEEYGTGQAKIVTDVLMHCDADICFLVETNAEWNEYLQSREDVCAKYPFQAWRNTDHWYAGGQHFLSRFPLEEVAWEPATSSWFPGWILQLQEDDNNPIGPAYFLSVHLRPPLSPSTSAPFGLSFTEYFQKSPKDHLNDMSNWLHVLGEIAHPEDTEQFPLFVLGDFNEERTGTAYKHLKSIGLQDARHQFCSKKHTWQWPVLNGWYTLKAKYDHMFYDPSKVQCVGADVIQEGCSDHFPVVGSFLLA